MFAVPPKIVDFYGSLKSITFKPKLRTTKTNIWAQVWLQMPVFGALINIPLLIVLLKFLIFTQQWTMKHQYVRQYFIRMKQSRMQIENTYNISLNCLVLLRKPFFSLYTAVKWSFAKILFLWQPDLGPGRHMQHDTNKMKPTEDREPTSEHLAVQHRCCTVYRLSLNMWIYV